MEINILVLVNIASFFLLCLAGTFASSSISPNGHHCSLSAIPYELQVPSGNKLHALYYAVGFQHYSYNGSSWVLFNATADLYKRPKGEIVGQHFFLSYPDAKGGQPSWETYQPNSLVTAKSLQAVTVDPKSVSWNLFQATSESGSRDALGAVTYLQRVCAKGGLPPTSSKGAQVGDIHATPYSIIYAYYVRQD